MFQDYSWLGAILRELLPQAPMFLAYLIAGIIAFAKLKRHPRASVFLLTSNSIFFISQIIFPVIRSLLRYFILRNVDDVTYTYSLLSLNIFASFIQSLAFVLLVSAVYVRRNFSGEEEQHHPNLK